MSGAFKGYWLALFLVPAALFGGVNASAAEGNDAAIEMQLIPDEVPTGKQFKGLVQIKNTGNSTWSSESGYHLSVLTPQPWGLDRVEFEEGTLVAPGETLVIRPKIMAPLVPGVYELQWQMGQNRQRFGESGRSIQVRVTGAMIPLNISEFVYQNTPEVMKAGETYSVTLQFKNTGVTAWTPGQFELVSSEDTGLTWMVDSIDIRTNAVVATGGFQAFRFDVRAPDEPGTYSFQWQMRQKGQSVFGEPSELIEVQVK